MKKAYLAVRVQQAHKRDAMLEGIAALGYELVSHPTHLDPPEALLITWNLHGTNDNQSSQIRKAGGAVICVENPYINHDVDGKEYLAMALNSHNGSGKTPFQNEDRLTRLGVEFEPWKEGEHILVIGQRGIGSPQMRSPSLWGEKTAQKLEHIQDRPVIHRPHPGRVIPEDLPSLESQMEGAYCLVMWASNCATTALRQGIPVFFDAPHCVLQKGCRKGHIDINSPIKSDERRLQAYRDLSYAQWNLDEVRTGEAYTRLMKCR